MAELETVRDLRRAQIIREARRLVAERGLEALTIGRLEKRLTFSRGVITYHFDSKQEIVDAVLQSAIVDIDQLIRAAVDTQATMVDRLRVAMQATVRGFLGQVEASRILLSFWSRLHDDDRARTINARLYARYRAECVQLLAAGCEAGELTLEGVDPDAVAAAMVGAVIGTVTQVYFDPDTVDPDAAITLAAEALLLRLRA